jgi:hypothetical protein
VQAVRSQAYAKVYLGWAYQEFVQNEIGAAQEHLLKAYELDSSLLHADGEGLPRKFLDSVVWFSVRDGGEHEPALESIFSHLPPAFLERYPGLPQTCKWASARGFLIRCLRALLWGHFEKGSHYFDRAIELGGRIDPGVLAILSDQITGYEMEYGAEETRHMIQNLLPFIRRAGSETDVRWLTGFYAITEAFNEYNRGRYEQVPGKVLEAVLSDPTHLTDRGVISILARSLVGMVR